MSKFLANVLSSLAVAIADAIARAIQRRAGKIEDAAAVKAAKAAKTAEEMRAASKRITDATNRDPS